MRKTWRFVSSIVLSPFRLLAWLIRKIHQAASGTASGIASFFAEEPEDTPLPDAFAKSVEHPSAILVHLDALRRHLLRSVLALGITTTLSFTFASKILEFLTRPLSGGLSSMVAIEVTEPIGTLMKVSLLSGFSLALPYIALELWLFIAPGVSRRTRLWGLLTIPVVSLFFLGGMAFAYYVMLPTAIPFLLNILGIPTQVRPSSYISFVTGLMFWVGMAFEFPLIIFGLAGLGLVRARFLLDQWRVAIILIAVAAAMITPTVDPVNMALVMGPMSILYFLSIGLAFLAQRGRPDSSQEG